MSDGDHTASRRPLLILAINVTGAIVVLVVLRMIAIRLFGVFLPDVLSLWGAATAGTLGLITAIVPQRVRLRAVAHVRAALTSRRSSTFIGTLLIISAAMCCIARYEIHWIGNSKIPVVINGRSTQFYSKPNAKGTNTAYRYSLAFTPYKLQMNSFIYSSRPSPLSTEIVQIPIFATEASDNRSYDIELTLLSSLFQLFEKEDIDAAGRLIDAFDPSTDADK